MRRPTLLTPPPMARPRSPSHGLVLLTVIVVITLAALTGTTAMYLASGEMAAAAGSLKRTQARALAWSGVQAAMAELADQRDKLLDGEPPSLTREWELFSEDGGARGVVRLAMLGETEAISETAKLDVNSATAEMLAKVPGIDPSLADRIVAGRSASPYSSIEALMRVQGMTAEKLLGGEADGEAGADPTARTGGLADVLTVFSFDPNVQSGLGANGSDHRGNLRLNLHADWSDALGQALDTRFGQGAGAAVKAVMGKGTKFASMADVLAAARTAGLKADAWAPLLDALTVTEDPYLTGRLDVNLASAEVLGAIPGISPEAAAQIVAARASLDAESQRTPAWIAAKGILTGEQFSKAVDHLTSRSMQWRIRVEAGIAPREEFDTSPEGPMANRVVLDAVIDVSSERPRVAYLRDATMLETARAMAAELAADDRERPSPAATEPDPEKPSEPAPSVAPGGRDLDLSSGLDKGVGDLDLGGLKLGGLNLGDPPASRPIQKQSAPPERAAPPPPDQPAPGIDRRLGRWTAGGSGRSSGGAGSAGDQGTGGGP